MYTLVMHSGLGSAAVEERALRGMSAQQVLAAGGVVLDDYAAASDAAWVAMRFAAGGIAPAGVRGIFHPQATVSGLALFVPDEVMRVFLALQRDAAVGVSADELMMAAEAVSTCPDRQAAPS